MEDNGFLNQIRLISPYIFSEDEREANTQSLLQDLQSRCRAINQQDREDWLKINSKEDWESFRNPRIDALKRSLGIFPSSAESPNLYVTRILKGDGYNIENIIYESRKGLYVTANLYKPSLTKDRLPAIIIIHSHHNPKTQGELQDMGMTWARNGCVVLVMDQLGYGERRQHIPGSRQDYRFRYINGIQLHVIGDSLMGWMVWDVMRGIDMLLDRYNVDEEKIILIGSVAGGGDVAAVASAIDTRIKCAVPFNFGGPQPETQYPLPDSAEETFDYMGSGSWESTRNLRLSGRDGFLHWVIVASIAPRYLIYAHEFSWDREHDPVWKRLQRVYGFYDASENLSFTHGSGVLSGQPPDATHCNNVGVIHRKMIHFALEQWFDIPIPQEYQNRLPEQKLMCLKQDSPVQQPLHKIFADIGISRSMTFQKSLDKLTHDEKINHLRQKWAELLGDINPKSDPNIQISKDQTNNGICVERILLKVEPNVTVPMLGIYKNFVTDKPHSAVIGIAQRGKDAFLKERIAEISDFIEKGFVVFLSDIRYTGENCSFESRDRQSESTFISATEWMLGQTVLGSQLRDLRSVIRYISTRSDIKSNEITLWGDSFAPTNPGGFKDLLIDEGQSPYQSEPLGAMLALFGALYEGNICAIIARGMIAGYQSILNDIYCYLPHDAIIPEAMTAGDLSDIIAALEPRLLRLEYLVEGRNCPLPYSDGY